jgi:NitT/TauT family transport system substrate-binding protein
MVSSIHTRRSRRIAATALIGAVALAISACSGGSPAPAESSGAAATGVDPYSPEITELSMLSYRLGASAPLFIAQMDGIDAEYGFSMNIDFTDSAANALAAIVGGTNQIAAAAHLSTVNAINEGMELVILGEQFRYGPGMQTMETRPDSGIESIEDLPGHTVGVGGLNGGQDLAIKWWFEENGLDWSGIQFTSVGPGEMGQALELGLIDAGVFAGPALAQVRESLGAVPVFDYGELMPDLPATSYIATREFAEANPNTIAAFQCAVVVKAAGLAAEGGTEYNQTIIDALEMGLGWTEEEVTGTGKVNFTSTNDPEYQQFGPDLFYDAGIFSERIVITDYLIPIPDNC